MKHLCHYSTNNFSGKAVFVICVRHILISKMYCYISNIIQEVLNFYKTLDGRGGEERILSNFEKNNVGIPSLHTLN